MDERVQATFDYGMLDAETRQTIQHEDAQFDRNMGEAGASFIRACHNLKRIHEKLRYRHPGFVDYCRSKQGLGERTAYRMIDVAKKFAETANIPSANKEALCLLTSPSTPEEARQEAIKRATAGERITPKVAYEIVERADQPTGHAVQYVPFSQQPSPEQPRPRSFVPVTMPSEPAMLGDPEADGNEDAAPTRLQLVPTSVPANPAHPSRKAFFRDRQREIREMRQREQRQAAMVAFFHVSEATANCRTKQDVLRLAGAPDTAVALERVRALRDALNRAEKLVAPE